MSSLTRRRPHESDHPQQLAPWAYSHQGAPAGEWDSRPDLRRLFTRLLRRKHYVAIVFLAVLIPAAVATFLATPLYGSVAVVQLNPDPVQVLPYRDVAANAIRANNIDDFVGTQQRILTGRGLRERVQHRLETEFAGEEVSQETERLVDAFEVREIERSQLIELRYQAEDPEHASTVANLYAEEYIKLTFELGQATRMTAERNLQTELATLEARLEDSEKELMIYAQANDIMSLEQGDVNPMQERLSFLTLQQAEAEARVAVAQSEREAAQSASVDDFPQRYANAEIATLNTRLFELEQELTGLRSRFGENWPAVVEARNELELVEAQAAREKAAILASHREQAELDLQAAQARRRTAQLAMDQEKEVMGEFRDASIQYNILRREVDTNRNLYEGVLERLRQTGVMAGVEFGNTHIVESARPTRRPESPNVVLNLGAASLLGLVLGLCLVIGMDFWDNSISSLEEVEALLPVASLGGVPWVKEAKMITAGPEAEQVEASSSLLELSTPVEESDPVPFPAEASSSLPFEVTESLRAICASILLARSDERPRVIVVTSASQAEGKTTISTRLGEAFADAGLKTLLVEADLRKPDLSEAFQLSPEGGLSLYLAGHLARPAVQETGTKNLHVMAGGPTPPNPAALFHSERLDAFLKTMVSEHEIVIVDTPPTLAIADARILGAKADGVVLVAKAGETPVTKIRRAAALLEDSGASVLGMVLNGWEPDGAEVSNYIYAAAAKRA